MNFGANGSNVVAVLPLIAVVLTAVAVLLVDLIVPRRRDAAIATAMIGLAIVAILVLAVGGWVVGAVRRTTPSPAYA